MTAPFLFAITEHIFYLTALLFPPVLGIVVLVIFLATFGKSLGLRERYVSILLRIFEVFLLLILSLKIKKFSGVLVNSKLLKM